MVSVAGFELNIIPDSIGSAFTTVFWTIMIFAGTGLLGWWLWRSHKNKTTYTYPITLTTYYDNGTSKTKYGLRGEKFVNNAGIHDFRIKIPKSFKKKDLGMTPDFSKADADDTIHFITSGDGSIWQQVEKKLEVSEQVQKLDENGKPMFDDEGNPILDDNYSIVFKPIGADIKLTTVNALKNWSEIVNKNKLTAMTISFVIFIIMVIAHLISLYIQTKACPTP